MLDHGGFPSPEQVVVTRAGRIRDSSEVRPTSPSITTGTDGALVLDSTAATSKLSETGGFD